MVTQGGRGGRDEGEVIRTSPEISVPWLPTRLAVPSQGPCCLARAWHLEGSVSVPGVGGGLPSLGLCWALVSPGSAGAPGRTHQHQGPQGQLLLGFPAPACPSDTRWGPGPEGQPRWLSLEWLDSTCGTRAPSGAIPQQQHPCPCPALLGSRWRSWALSQAPVCVGGYPGTGREGGSLQASRGSESTPAPSLSSTALDLIRL